jgi:hypothetical protein
MVIAETLSDKLRRVGTIFALFKKRMPVNRGIRPYQLLKSGGRGASWQQSVPNAERRNEGLYIKIYVTE